MSSNVAEIDLPEAPSILNAPLAPTANTNRYKTIRKVSLRIALAAGAIFAADTARVVCLRSSPSVTLAAVRPYGSTPRAVPDRETPLPELFDMLRNPKDAAAFLKKYQKHETPKSSVSFTTTFRRSAKTFLQRGSGCCNNYAEFWGELWMATGRKPYLVCMWPTGERCANKKSEGIKGKGWHMITVFSRINTETGKTQLVIGDNDDAVYWDGTLEEYVASKEMEILPFGGVQPFSPAADNHDFKAKICDLSRQNASMQLSDDPLIVPHELTIAAR